MLTLSGSIHADASSKMAQACAATAYGRPAFHAVFSQVFSLRRSLWRGRCSEGARCRTSGACTKCCARARALGLRARRRGLQARLGMSPACDGSPPGSARNHMCCMRLYVARHRRAPNLPRAPYAFARTTSHPSPGHARAPTRRPTRRAVVVTVLRRDLHSARPL